ncbi:hypothetical protein SAMD00019534_125710 [Acytostelium subglobosum LB1]|uniref:hypothetical protein n=1 Tax=Acytostelium subglobosum LB1 TaxID=1410327 RepID=UPI000644BC6A|nr:hypothetical protein SAMD00019534_125710 [Acytostelium subglobosum LB1]GAM29395.1 hypothetical protein SAMD00019534_125710 [Acytostelium subglobosum LB1]|eukprot:XP_012747663.1 hypothetical protein SAMD00019534_125710 [Acytostelium subglobosum LB1]
MDYHTNNITDTVPEELPIFTQNKDGGYTITRGDILPKVEPIETDEDESVEDEEGEIGDDTTMTVVDKSPQKKRRVTGDPRPNLKKQRKPSTSTDGDSDSAPNDLTFVYRPMDYGKVKPFLVTNQQLKTAKGIDGLQYFTDPLGVKTHLVVGVRIPPSSDIIASGFSTFLGLILSMFIKSPPLGKQFLALFKTFSDENNNVDLSASSLLLFHDNCLTKAPKEVRSFTFAVLWVLNNIVDQLHPEHRESFRVHPDQLGVITSAIGTGIDPINYPALADLSIRSIPTESGLYREDEAIRLDVDQFAKKAQKKKQQAEAEKEAAAASKPSGLCSQLKIDDGEDIDDNECDDSDADQEDDDGFQRYNNLTYKVGVTITKNRVKVRELGSRSVICTISPIKKRQFNIKKKPQEE